MAYVNLQQWIFFFDVMLTVLHLSMFISVFNQLDAQNLFHNKFYFMPLHVSSTCAHHQEVKIASHSLWYHHTYRCDDTRLKLQPATRTPLKSSRTKSPTHNEPRTKTTDVVIQQHSRKLLMMDILMSETCRVRSEIK